MDLSRRGIITLKLFIWSRSERSARYPLGRGSYRQSYRQLHTQVSHSDTTTWRALPIVPAANHICATFDTFVLSGVVAAAAWPSGTKPVKLEPILAHLGAAPAPLLRFGLPQCTNEPTAGCRWECDGLSSWNTLN